MLSDNVIAALIAGAVALVTGAGGWHAGRVLKREGAVESNLSVQLKGWQDLAASMRERIEELEERVTECERDRAALWRQLRDLDLRGDC